MIRLCMQLVVKYPIISDIKSIYFKLAEPPRIVRARRNIALYAQNFKIAKQKRKFKKNSARIPINFIERRRKYT